MEIYRQFTFCWCLFGSNLWIYFFNSLFLGVHLPLICGNISSNQFFLCFLLDFYELHLFASNREHFIFPGNLGLFAVEIFRQSTLFFLLDGDLLPQIWVKWDMFDFRSSGTPNQNEIKWPSLELDRQRQRQLFICLAKADVHKEST